VVATTITLLHHSALPNPVPATFTDLIRATYDSEMVRVQATVRAADIVTSAGGSECSGRLQLQMEGGHIETNIDTCDETTLKGLLDDDVELAGVAAGKFDDKMQQTGVVLYVSSLADIKILKHSNTSPWSLPLRPMGDILAESNVRDLTRRVHVRGTITYYEPGAAVVLEDGSKSLWISTHSRVPLQLGDLADATGFPDAHDRMLTLTDGEIRDNRIQSPVFPQSATWRELAFWDSSKPVGHQYDLVSTGGLVVAEVREASQDEYVLSSNGKLFTAIYRHPHGSATLQAVRRIPIGSRIRVTGICTILDTHAINPGEEVPFNILLRSFDDIAILAGPPLLNKRNLLVLAGILFALVLILIARDWHIERKVRRENAKAAYAERRRALILEDINGSRSLAEILEEIAEFASLKLESAPCWCQITDGAKLGCCPGALDLFRVVREQIPARNGSSHGTMYAAFPPSTRPETPETETLKIAAGLAGLAIENRRLYSDLQHRSEFDVLTEINNRFSLERCLDAQIEEARRKAGVFGLIYIDLDRFKQVNDSYGHLVGDLYLREAASRMKHQLRSHDMLARLGGDEFAVVLPMVHSRVEVEEIAHRLEHAFDESFSLKEYVLKGSASIGVALYPEDGRTRDCLLSTADAVMYVRKQTNRHADKSLAIG
jgi:diguanylate cyclase (GGDEF)-like protein